MSTPVRSREVKCPTCGKAVLWVPENAFRPFCSERCRKIDLGAWASDTYRVAGETPLDDGADPLTRA